MDFASLFTRLSAVEEDVKSPGQPAYTHRNEAENDKRGKVRKKEGWQTSPYKKKRCYQAQMTRTYNATWDGSKDKRYHNYNTDSEHASVGFTKEAKHGCSDNAGRNYTCYKGQNYKAKNYRNVNKQQEQKKMPEGQENHHRQKDRGRPACRGGSQQTRPTLRRSGGDRRNAKDKQDFRAKCPRFMTQEFKDQNVLSVDGQLLCKHFLSGRCIKGDDCQLAHVEGYNDLIKEVCKFYIQGFCTKGGSCPYMHKSFPCKYFHRNRCSKGADCKFSHDPLNDITKSLLDEAFKRDKDLYELAKKAEQESSGQPATTDEPEIIEANRTPDIFKNPLRPNFYKSVDTDAEKEALLCQTDELNEAVLPPASDAALPQSSSSTNLNLQEPVCYSVEAMLGSQLYKPFTSFYMPPRSHESASLSSSDCTSGSANQNQIPYSVDAVLRSCKSVENSTFGHTPSPLTAQTVSYSPKTCFEEITDPLLSSETPNKKVLCSVNTRYEVNKSQDNMFTGISPLQVHTGLISKTCPNLTLASGNQKKLGGNMPESLKTAQGASHEVKLEMLSTDISCSLNYKPEGVPPFGPGKHKSIFSRPPRQTSASNPTKLKPHFSALKCDSQASFKPFCPSSGFTEFKGRSAVPAEPVGPIKSSDSANCVIPHVEAKQPTEIHLHSKKTQSALKLGTEQLYSTETTAECSSKMAHCGDLAVGCKKTLKRPFHSLFASPITDTKQPIDDSVTSSSCPQGSIQSPCPAPQPADYRSNHLKTLSEPVKASARSFLSLFSAPLSAVPLPCVQSQPDYSRTSSCSQQSVHPVDNASHSSDSKQRTSNLETQLPRHVRTDVKEISLAPRSSNSSPNAKTKKNDSSTEHVNQPTKQLVTPICSLPSDSLSEMSTSPASCDNSPSTSHAPQQLPDILSHKAATTNSVLKTLFLCLSPYQQDGDQQDIVQISVPSESEKKDKSSTGCVFVKQQLKSKTMGRQKKKLETQDSHKQLDEKTAVHSREHQPSLQTTEISLEITSGSTLSSPGMTEPRIRNSEPVMALMQHHTRPRLKPTSEEEKWLNGNVAATPLKDLFKTF